MTMPWLGAAIGIVRAWTRFYTWRMDPTSRARRRAEIDSDLWEFLRNEIDCRAVTRSLHIVFRLVGGIPDDIAWRLENDDFGDKLMRKTVLIVATSVAVLAV